MEDLLQNSGRRVEWVVPKMKKDSVCAVVGSVLGTPGSDPVEGPLEDRLQDFCLVSSLTEALEELIYFPLCIVG